MKKLLRFRILKDICFLMLVLPLTVQVYADPTLLDLRISTSSGSINMQPAIAMNRAGHTIIAWQSSDVDGSSYVYGQIITRRGLVHYGNFIIHETEGVAHQATPDVAMNDKGHFVVVWQDQGDSINVMAKLFYANGVPKSGPIAVCEQSPQTITQPSVAMDSLGNFVVCWKDVRNGHPDIFAQRFNRAGTPIGHNFQVNDFISWERSVPDVAMGNDGRFVIVWQDSRNLGVSDIYLQMYDSTGHPIGMNQEVSTHLGQETDARAPAVAIHKNGNFLVCWDFAYTMGSLNVYGKLFDADGNTLKEPFIINETGGAYDHLDPDVAINPSGGYGVVWVTNLEGTLDIRGRMLDNEGEPLGPSVRLNDPNGDQVDAAIAIDGRNIGLFVWRDSRDGTHQIFGTWSGSVNLQQWVPLNLVAGNGFDGMIPLSWDHLYGMPQIAMYHVYRSTVSGGPYTKIATVNLMDRGILGSKMLDWIDTDVENGRYYYYVVTAEASGIEGPYSTEVHASPRADGHVTESVFCNDPPNINGDITFEWNDAELLWIDDRFIPGWVNVAILNDASHLYIAVFDNNDQVVDTYNVLRLMFDINNNGTWDAGQDGILMITPAVTGFIPFSGTYPNNISTADVISSPVGVESSIMSTEYGMGYEISIDLTASPVQAEAGSTIGFGISLSDPSNTYPYHYGYAGEWPMGLLWETAETLGDLILASPPTDLAAENNQRPGQFVLFPNYPNPFNPETTIAFELPGRSHVLLRVYSLQGQLIRTLKNSTLDAGYHSVKWDARDANGVLVANGVYMYRLTAGDRVVSRKMLLLK